LIAEDRAPAPISKRGIMRAEHEAQIRGAGIKYALLRLPEFYGPHVVTLTPRMIRAALDGTRARWPGPLDVPIELVYMPDAAVAMIAVAARGEDDVVHLPGVHTTARAFIAAAFAAVGAPMRASGTPAWLLSLAGLFDATIRSVADIGHLWTHPIMLDGARYASRYGAPRVTPLPEALAATVAWLRTATSVRLQG
jgi:nucleoside-diphosphate-sugar epimerase